ncbi:TetR/AcrR family transcriptional regulator [Actinomadura pelletieri]|uniref:TetR/AcrR family transcriptional regulator n=1 Tax=Actinomadura pelletieri TaxID=111805 RepID=UPI001FE9773C|nr:TetR/AcrR family transcriptional regulator [Actinomadura pelletieri]
MFWITARRRAFSGRRKGGSIPFCRRNTAPTLGRPTPGEERAVGDRPRAGRNGGRSLPGLGLDQRRNEPIAAAPRPFDTRSPEDVSTGDVAASKGASRALVHHHFGGGHELYPATLGGAAKRLSVLLEPPTGGGPLDRPRISLSRHFDFVEGHAAGYTTLSRDGPTDRSGKVREIIAGIRQLLPDRILQSPDVATPRPILRITLRAWSAAIETAGPDWLEHRDVPRPQLEGLLIDHLMVIFNTAERHNPGTGHLFDRPAREGMG